MIGFSRERRVAAMLAHAFKSHRVSIAASWFVQATLRCLVLLTPASLAILPLPLSQTRFVGAMLIASALLAFGSLLRHRLTARSRARAFAFTSARIAQGSSLSPLLTEAHQIEYKLFSAINTIARLLAEQVPSLLAASSALIVVSVPVVRVFGFRSTLFFAVFAAVAVFVLLVARRSLVRSHQALHTKAVATMDKWTCLLQGHLSLTASGMMQGHLKKTEQAANDYVRHLGRFEVLSTLVGRAPIAIALAAALVTTALVFDDGWSHPDTWLRMLILGSAFPAVVLLGRSASDLLRSLRDLGPWSLWVDGQAAPHSPTNPKPVPERASLSFRHVVHHYEEGGPQSLAPVLWTWRFGESVGLTGPNGVGKTTLVRLLLRLIDPTAGSILVGADDLRQLDLSQWRARISYLPQRPLLLPHHTLRESMDLVSDNWKESDLLLWLDRLGLLATLFDRNPKDPLGARISQFSAGQQQRFAVARALAQPSEFLILDEPDSNLDEPGMHFLISWVPKEVEKRSILLIAHDPRLLACMSRTIKLGSSTNNFDAHPPTEN